MLTRDELPTYSWLRWLSFREATALEAKGRLGVGKSYCCSLTSNNQQAILKDLLDLQSLKMEKDKHVEPSSSLHA